MNREKLKEQVMMNTAFAFAHLSTCCRIQVGAVIVTEGRIISVGYNGTPSDQEHCFKHFEDYWKELGVTGYIDLPWEKYLDSWMFKDLHHNWAIRNELHAEINAITHAAKKGIATEGASLFITHSPCIHCVKDIISSGIKKVICSKIYSEKELPDVQSTFSKNNIIFRRIANGNCRRPGLFWQNYNK